MLSILKRGTALAADRTWEFHGDSDDPKIFYITPHPQFVMNAGLPAIELVEYTSSDSLNGSGYVRLQIELGVPAGVIAPIKAKIAELFGVTDPVFLTLPVQSGTSVRVTYPDGQGGTTGQQIGATDFGANNAIAQLQLDADQMREVKAIMNGNGTSPFEIQYAVLVPSTMPSVKIRLSFDSSIAFQYQVTEHKHEKWNQATQYTYDINKLLSASNAAVVEIDKIDPTIPATAVTELRNWSQQVIETRVAAEVAQKVALLERSGGTQSFRIDQVSSFSQTYIQNETMLWRVHPIAVLPSFGQLGLSSAQRASLETQVDTRQFIATLTPAVKFVSQISPLAISAEGAIGDSDNPYMSDIKPLQSLAVTMRYPTLDGHPSRTHTYYSNQAHSWTADWDEQAGGVYSFDYLATYDDGQQISGKFEDIDQSEFVLRLADVGILNITFNATNIFPPLTPPELLATAGSGDVDRMEINLVFEVPDAEPFLQKVTLDAGNPIATVSSQFASPVSTYYAFTTTYHFKPELKANPFVSNVRRLNSEFSEVLAPDFQQDVPILVDMGGINGVGELMQLTMNFYYQDAPIFPDIPASKALPRPTQGSPIQFRFDPLVNPPAGGTANFRIEQFSIFANSRLSPLKLVAQAITAEGKQLKWDHQNFTPQDVASLFFSAKSLFRFVQLDPVIVKWDTDPNGNPDKLVKIDLRVVSATFKSSSGDGTDFTVHPTGSTQSIAYDHEQKKAPSAYFEVNGLAVDAYDLKFTWQATYVYAAAGSFTMEATSSGTSVALPAVPPVTGC